MSEQAIRLLTRYLKPSWEAAGLCWDGDNDAEIAELVGLLTEAQPLRPVGTVTRTPAAKFDLAELERHPELMKIWRAFSKGVTDRVESATGRSEI